MKFNIFVLLVLVSLAMGVATVRTRVTVAHNRIIDLADPEFLKVNSRIESTYPNLYLKKPVRVTRILDTFPRTWSITYRTGIKPIEFQVIEFKEGEYNIRNISAN